MGQKLKSCTTVLYGEPKTTRESSHNPELKAEKKKKKKHKDNKDEPNPKRKLEEIEPLEIQKKKRDKTKGDDSESKTHQGKEESKRNNDIDDDETVRDGLVVVTRKNVKASKYSPLRSFAESRLPEDVLECYKNFQSPSLI